MCDYSKNFSSGCIKGLISPRCYGESRRRLWQFLPVVRSMCEINLEAELFTLQDSNAKLVEALQEANSSVEQWKKQLSEYQEETDRLRDQVTCTSLENVTLWKCLSGYLRENNCNYWKSKLHAQAYQVSIALLLQCILGFVVVFIIEIEIEIVPSFTFVSAG